MTPRITLPDRRRFLSRTLGAALLAAAPGAYAELLTLTPAQTEGPFYPDRLPLDTDNDLLILNDTLTPASGEITWLSGRVLDARGHPLRNATVEIWQCDAHGVYLHSRGGDRQKIDPHFQGFGRFLTGSTGEYLFRTIKPVPYPGRTPHIHVAVKRTGQPKFTTQCYVRGEPANEKDGIWRNLSDARQRDAVTVAFAPLPGSPAGELQARFDIVLGVTPEA
ncbi:MAG: intradiol ring-cleavage dioxygenase [Verrucomicrobiae bacterium]|nr:intradiol ring-cleavage dioxygenase [Verrucomicrobiae bacterium]